MGSLVRMAAKLEEKRKEAGRIKRRAERDLKDTISEYRRSSSGLAAVERGIERAKEQAEEISGELIRRAEQRDSVKRLVAIAEEKLAYEKETREMARQDAEMAGTKEDKKAAEFRLRSATSRIEDLVHEIKARNKTVKKITSAIEEYSTSKSKVSGRIRKSAGKKPALKKMIKKSGRAKEILAKRVASKSKQEGAARSGLKKINSKVKELQERRAASKRAASRKKAASGKKQSGKKPRRTAKRAAPKRKAPGKKRAAAKRRAPARRKRPGARR